MSLSDDKRNVFTTIGAYTSFAQQNKLPKSTDLYTSVNNKNDIIPFLLDTLKVVAGSEISKELVGELLTTLIDDSEKQVKTVLKKQFTQSNSGDLLPSDFTNNGLTISIKSIDVRNKFKQAPTGKTGHLIYDNLKPNFDKAVYNTILNGSPQTYSNLKIQYIEPTDSINIKPTTNVNIGKFFGDYIDGAEFINKKEIINNILDAIYGSSTSNQNKTIGQVHEELQASKLLEQALNGDDSFDISASDDNDLLEKAKELNNGVTYYDMGCGLLEAILPLNTFSNTVSTISGSTDPFVVGNTIANTINQSTTGNTETTSQNEATVKDGFFQKIIKIFINEMLHAATTSPQIRALLAITSLFQHNQNTNISKPTEDMKKNKIFIMCMAQEIMRMIAEFIFNMAIAYLIKLLTPVIKKIIKEKTKQYNDIVKSLTEQKNLNTTT